MNRFTPTLIKLGAIAALAVGSYALTPLAFAAPPAEPVAATAADLQANADHYAMRAADYRARAKTDSKRAIVWFTMANYCDQKAEHYRMAAQAAGAEPDTGADRIGALGRSDCLVERIGPADLPAPLLRRDRASMRRGAVPGDDTEATDKRVLDRAFNTSNGREARHGTPRTIDL